MLMNTRLYHEDGECCGGHGHGEGGCCHGEGHGHGHGEGGCCRGEGHTHSHEHEHADGTRHCHAHDHTGYHCHEHAPEALSADEKVALLAYMIRHNGHHLDELHTLALQLDGEAAAYLNDAVEQLAQSNAHLVKAYYALTSAEKED